MAIGDYRKLAAHLLLPVLLASYVSAQQADTLPERLTISDGTPVELRLANNISSAHAHPGDPVDFLVVRDVSVEGYTVIKAGTLAHGSVTSVNGRRIFGIGGQVSLRLDSVDMVNGEQVGLHATKQVKGSSRTFLMIGGMIVTGLVFLPAAPIFLLTRGHTSTIVKSTEITAKVDCPTSILTAGLHRSLNDTSQLAEMMDYLPPRVFDGEGREGDMLNLVFVAQQEDLQGAFKRAGWVSTDKWRPSFVWHLIQHRTKDTLLPMARFYLFGRVQDYSYALPDPDAIVTRRHHLRIWKTGYTVDGTPIWAGAATHDVSIEIAKNGHLINHRIDPAVDEERDFVGADLTDTSSVSRQEYLQGVSPVFEAQTASGEDYHSDSRILLLDLHSTGAHGKSLSNQPTDIAHTILLPKPTTAKATSASPLR